VITAMFLLKRMAIFAGIPAQLGIIAHQNNTVKHFQEINLQKICRFCPFETFFRIH